MRLSSAVESSKRRNAPPVTGRPLRTPMSRPPLGGANSSAGYPRSHFATACSVAPYLVAYSTASSASSGSASGSSWPTATKRSSSVARTVITSMSNASRRAAFLSLRFARGDRIYPQVVSADAYRWAMASTMTGKVAFVTGGASGIGAALATKLAGAGAEVWIADRQIDKARQLAQGLGSNGAKAHAIELDVRDDPSFERAVADAVQEAGRIDYLFNNAGIGVSGEIASYTLEDWNDVFDVNLRGVVHGS